MTTRKLLVLIDNVPGELPIGDSVDLSTAIKAKDILKAILVDSNDSIASILFDSDSILYNDDKELN